MGDRGPKACGPCVALASRECHTNPDRKSVCTFVPAEYRLEHSLEATAAVCRSRLCHALVRLRVEPQPAGRPVGWTKRGRDATEVVIGTIAKAEHGRQKPAIVTDIFEVKASRCAACTSPSPSPPPASPPRPPATGFSTDSIAAPSMQVRSNRLRAVYNRREHPGREQE